MFIAGHKVTIKNTATSVKKKNSTRQREDKQRCLTSDTMRV